MSDVRTDWTRDEIAALFDLPFTELLFRAASVHREHHPTRTAGLRQPTAAAYVLAALNQCRTRSRLCRIGTGRWHACICHPALKLLGSHRAGK